MKQLHTYPVGFREISSSEAFFYTVNSGIPISEAENEFECILDSIAGILRIQVLGSSQIDSAQALIEITCDLIAGGQVPGESKCELFEHARNHLKNASNIIVNFLGGSILDTIPLNKESLYGAMLLLNMAIALCDSIIESCKRSGA